jgi:hypothetical protein
MKLCVISRHKYPSSVTMIQTLVTYDIVIYGIIDAAAKCLVNVRKLNFELRPEVLLVTGVE